MQTSTLFALLLLLILVAYGAGISRALTVAHKRGGLRKLAALPGYYGSYTALWCGLPALLLLGTWLIFDDAIIRALVMDRIADKPDTIAGQNLLYAQIQNLASGRLIGDAAPQLQEAALQLNRLRTGSRNLQAALSLILAVGLGAFALLRFSPELRAREKVEQVLRWVLLTCACAAIFTTVGILLSVLFESLRFFQTVPLTEFLFGLHWSPQMALRADQVGSSGAFGAVPLITGTLMVSVIAMFVAVPVGLMSAIYLAEYASKRVRALAKPVLEILAGVPTVVYGFFAALTVAPFVRDLAASLGLQASSESALAAGLVMGVMIIPFVSSLSDDVINAVPQSLRDGALGLGSTRSETVRKVVIPAALPGIVGGVLLAVSRAIGETMIVVMAAGLTANLTANPLESVTTVTVQIVTLLVGDQEFDSPKTLAAFALGLMLFISTLMLNFVALHVVKKYREQYD
ncbi:phosphate ABC transporter permease subunit PstC [Microbulbifer thermotolerans]|uniref:Phosphate transport system permease protein n=1 Tax=Microbulbifer thermotolerans TaxID=252514 RepID=A0A143HRJ4_MICTH|nr:phosphate ABC transporter permease subunit PstC [Microbulbifer thermotolerans]AMX03892.1 phosphate ABC transporter permease [Microbulbifer thermotolerans]MCX2794065.1 phosphate ABC transporter permease subunit PstC [Microbulbifer thermotolerans]MCX2840963.1 phosphate ABC transporter permease subunit PstC [Microbulbifer thermotolerans]WKT60546.1 phosphate ABC transporter permease subunit PstC [Microbulbifer thermotolerans]